MNSCMSTTGMFGQLLAQEFDHHTTEEEEKWMPELVQALDGDQVQKLSERFSATKMHEPTR